MDKRLKVAQWQTKGDQSEDYYSNSDERGGAFIRTEIVQMERSDWMLDLSWRWSRQDLYMDWMWCTREMKNDSKIISKMGKQKCHLLRCGIQGDKHVLGEWNQEPLRPCY